MYCEIHAFFINNTFINKVKLKLEKKKIRQKLSNTLRLNVHNLKTINFHHPRHHAKIIGNVLKNVQKTSVIILMTLYN